MPVSGAFAWKFNYRTAVKDDLVNIGLLAELVDGRPGLVQGVGGKVDGRLYRAALPVRPPDIYQQERALGVLAGVRVCV